MRNSPNKAEISSSILNAVTDMRTFSFEEKKHAYYTENHTDLLLDAILDIKKSLINRTEILHLFNASAEKLTWYNNLDNDDLLIVNDLVAFIKDAYSSLMRNYKSLNVLRRKGIAKNEIKNFKNAIDELKETYQDLESVFFFLPAMPVFKDTTKQLNKLPPLKTSKEAVFIFSKR